MNAIELLEEQHDEALKLCRLLAESAPGDERKQLFNRLSIVLLAHMVIEEELFYPTAAHAKADSEPIVEAYEAHHAARDALVRCDKVLKERELFQVRVRVLRELLEHHIAGERSELFPQARRDLGTDALEGLGLEMEVVYARALNAGNPSHKLDRLSTDRELDALSV